MEYVEAQLMVMRIAIVTLAGNAAVKVPFANAFSRNMHALRELGIASQNTDGFLKDLGEAEARMLEALGAQPPSK
jgi:hypothetical protein